MDPDTSFDAGGAANEGEVLPRVQRSMLSKDIYEHLQAFILAGTIKPGTRIVEEHLAKQLGTSRAPLREAIWRLKSDGLITGSGRDTRTVALMIDDIRELHLLRATLETLLYQSVAQCISQEDMSTMDRLVEQMLHASAEREDERLSDLDYEFHHKLALASDLPRAYQVWQEQHVLFRLWLNVVAEAEDDPREIAAHHSVLLDAIRSRQPERIAREVTHHVYGLGCVYLEERTRWAEERDMLVGDSRDIAQRDDVEAG